MDDLNVRARWAARQEPIEECASRAVECLRRLGECDEAFRKWFKRGMSREEALASRVEVTLEACQDLLARGRNRRDFDNTVIEELGFATSLWNGRDGDAGAGVSFACGQYPDATILPGPNQCCVDLPYGGGAAKRVLRLGKLKCVTAAVVGSWNPDWVRVSTYAMDQAVYPSTYRGQMAGWLTYASDRYGALPRLPREYETTDVEGLGSLIVIRGVGRLTAANPAHVEAVRRLSQALDRAGLLQPTPPTGGGRPERP